ncbi:MAG: extracellular solute-binding protein [Thaumarchaeota archaeon]|nr:extracellular solute-binding protein [Nitrososphaerota archaeon]
MSAESPTIQKAKKEGRVLVYGTVELDEFAGWKDSFEKKYPGVEVEYQRKYVPGTPPPMAKQIMEEAEAGKETADAVIVAVPPLLQFRGLNLLAKTKLKEAAAYPKGVRQPQGYWFPIVSIPMIQVYNPKLVSKKELPRTAMDLTNPKWKEAIVSHDLSIGTLGAYWLASLRPIFGEKKWREFVEGLAKNRPKGYPLYDTVVDSVANGDSRIGLTVLFHDYLKAKKAKRAIERLKLRDVPMMMTFNAIAKTTRGSHPASAELLIEYLLSKEGQKKVGSTYLRIPARMGTGARYSLDKLVPKSEKLVEYPSEKMLRGAVDSISVLTRLFAQR